MRYSGMDSRMKQLDLQLLPHASPPCCLPHCCLSARVPCRRFGNSYAALEEAAALACEMGPRSPAAKEATLKAAVTTLGLVRCWVAECNCERLRVGVAIACWPLDVSALGEPQRHICQPD